MKKDLGLKILFIILIITSVTFIVLYTENEIENNKTQREKDAEKLTFKIPTNYKINKKYQADASLGLYKKLFKKDSIEKVYIEIDNNNFDYLIKYAQEKPYVLAKSLTINDEKIEYVGIKTKGNISLRGVTSDRFSFTVNVSKYIKKKDYGETQNFYGISKISFNNCFEDSTLLREYLSYTLMNKMNVPSPYFSLVELYVNNEVYGLYFMVEAIDEDLTERIYEDKKGFLAKPELPGSTLIYKEELDNYVVDGKYVFDTITYNKKSNVLYQYLGILTEKAGGEEITDEDADKEKLNEELDLLFSWMKKLNTYAEIKNKNTKEYKEKVEKIIDVDLLIKHMAINTFLGNEDSYYGHMSHNYGLYINKDSYMKIIPWDYNLSFNDKIIDKKITNPLYGINLNSRPLARIIMENEDYYKQYINAVKMVNNIASNNNYLIGILKEMDKEIVKEYNSDPRPFYSFAEHQTGIKNLQYNIKNRIKSINAQITKM